MLSHTGQFVSNGVVGLGVGLKTKRFILGLGIAVSGHDLAFSGLRLGLQLY